MFSKLSYDWKEDDEVVKNVVALSYASPGAMGWAGTIFYVTDEAEFFGVDYCELNWGWEKLCEVFPMLVGAKFGMIGPWSHPSPGYRYVSLGMGNHLLVRREFYNELMTRWEKMLAGNPNCGILYKHWKDIVIDIVTLVSTKKIKIAL